MQQRSAEQPREPVPLLRPCPVDAFRQYRCGVPADGEGCPPRPTALQVVQRGPWEPAPEAETLDLGLTRAFSGAPRGRTCCYSSCVAVEVHTRAVSADISYRSLACLPGMTPSHPAPGHPRCPAAIRFPDDWMNHIAAFDEEGTRARAREYAAQPEFAGVAWCCYRRAPAAAIGPL